MTLPAHVERNVRRILKGAALRILTDELDAQAVSTPTRGNGHARHRRGNQRSSLGKGQPIPVGAGADRKSGSEVG